MSLEAALAANTAALQAHTAAMLAMAGGKALPAADVKVAATPAPAAPAAPAASTPTPAPATSTAAVTFEEIKVPFLALSRSHGRDAVAGILEKHGKLKLLSEAKPEQFAAILVDIKAAAALTPPAK